VDIDEAFEPILALDTTSRLWILNVGKFDEMVDNPCSIVRNLFFGRINHFSS